MAALAPVLLIACFASAWVALRLLRHTQDAWSLYFVVLALFAGMGAIRILSSVAEDE